MQITDLRALGNIINTTWGKYSSSGGTHSIKVDLAGDVMTAKYTTVVHFAADLPLTPQMVTCREEAVQRIDAYVAEMKTAFRETTGNSLRLQDAQMHDAVELLQATAISPRRVAYFRLNATYTVT